MPRRCCVVLEGRFRTRLDHVRDIIGLAPGVREMSALSLLVSSHVDRCFWPTRMCGPIRPRSEIADMTLLCAQHVRRFGLVPKAALVSHSDFGSANTPSALSKCARR